MASLVSAIVCVTQAFVLVRFLRTHWIFIINTLIARGLNAVDTLEFYIF